MVTGAWIVCASGADYAQVGALAKTGRWEIGVSFDSSVNRSTALSVNNYILPAGAQIEGLRQEALNNSVVLTVSGLSTNSTYTLTVTNVQNTSGSTLPVAALPFTTKPMSWAAVGGQEFGFEPNAVAVGDDGFDLISGGVEMWNIYDEATFAYEQISGDFDKRVRVVSQESSSEEARAGLMVREALDEGRPRPADPTNPAEAFSRYIQVQVNPTNTAYTDFSGNAVPGRNQHQVNVRFYTGGIGNPNFQGTENPTLTDNAPPTHPNAWLRLKRVGQTFHVFRSSEGTNWVRLGSYTFPKTDADGNAVPPFSNTAFVGPNYSPETGNIPESSGARRAFIARFRDYSNATGDVNVDPPQLSIARTGNQVEITWNTGTLQGATNIVGDNWTDLGTASPLKLTPDKRTQFFRARNP